MSYWGGAWSSLKFSASSTGTSLASGSSWSYRRVGDGNLEYKNNRAYNFVLVHVAKQIAFQAVNAEISKLFPRYQRYLESKLRDKVLEQQTDNYTTLIANQSDQTQTYGVIITEEGNAIYANDPYGARITESLMLYYHGENTITVSQWYKLNGEAKTYEISTKTVCFIDLSPQISIRGGKNIIKTQVQGRDYTRKELVSGGDLTFTISGNIVSNEMGVYPDNDVQKFIQLAQYAGVIQVNHLILQQLNITQLIIEDYTLPPPTCKNIQPYTLSCVAIEPDEAVSITKDTIGTLNDEIQESEMNTWYKLILNSKLVEIAAGVATSAVSSTINLIDTGDGI